MEYSTADWKRNVTKSFERMLLQQFFICVFTYKRDRYLLHSRREEKVMEKSNSICSVRL